MALSGTPPAAADLADRFASLRHAVQAHAQAARSCVQSVLVAMLLFLVARQLRRVERILRSLPAAPLPTSDHAGESTAPQHRLTRHGGAFIPRRLRAEKLHIWWDAHRGARAIPGRAARAPRPHPARAPPPSLPPCLNAPPSAPPHLTRGGPPTR